MQRTTVAMVSERMWFPALARERIARIRSPNCSGSERVGHPAPSAFAKPLHSEEKTFYVKALRRTVLNFCDF